MGRHRLCGFPQSLGTAVVPEARPLVEHVSERRRSEVGGGREPLQEPLVAGRHPVDLGLLEHHLADEDPVRIAGVAPGKVAMTGSVPVEERGLSVATDRQRRLLLRCGRR